MRYVELIRGRDYLGHGVKASKGTLLEVSDEKAEELVSSGFFCYSNVKRPDSKLMTEQKEDLGESEKTPIFEKMKAAELKSYANENGIDISGCKNNSDRIDLIKAVMCTDRTEKHEDEFSVMNNKSDESDEMLNFDQ